MNENEKPLVAGEPVPPGPSDEARFIKLQSIPVEEKHECGADCQHEHIRGVRTKAIVVDDAADFHSDKPNEGGDYFPPAHEGGCPSGPPGTTGEPGPPASVRGITGSSGKPSFSPRADRRNTHRLRHRSGRLTAVPGLAVICPSGSRLIAQKRIGPNDKCSCGSGKKYKKCCLNKSS